MNITSAEKLFRSSISLFDLSQDSVEDARQRFLSFQKSGVIRTECSFDSCEWQTTDQYSNIGLLFTFNIFSYNAYYKNLLNLTIEEFVLYVKTFIISIFGKRVLLTMQTFLRDIRDIINTPREQVYGLSKDLYLRRPNICGDFFSLLAVSAESEEAFILAENVERYAEANHRENSDSQRALSDFDTYFLFDFLIKDYWKSNLSKDERCFYYPLYLWWSITGVIPLRPREFLLTERECLSFRDGKYWLRLRRNQLKGGNRNITYKLVNDYAVDTYEIPSNIAKEIQNYIDLTAQFEDNELHTLFRTEGHYSHWGRSKFITSRYLTYNNMRTILSYFYQEVLQDKYGLQIVYLDENQHIGKNEISQIHLGDTRHLALINLMQSGGTPMLAMYLAGHTNDQTAFSYYSNITRMIECETYMMRNKLMSEGRTIQVAPLQVKRPSGEYVVLADGTLCYSKLYPKKDYTDCDNAFGPDGEIGACYSCEKHRLQHLTYHEEADIYKRKVQDDCEVLRYAVEVYRSGRGAVETIGEALLRLQFSSESYREFLKEKGRKLNG